jgi:hypothetical protein
MSDHFRDNLPNICLYEINAFFSSYKNGCKRIRFYHLATEIGETQTCNCLYTKPLFFAHLFYAFFVLTPLAFTPLRNLYSFAVMPLVNLHHFLICTLSHFQFAFSYTNMLFMIGI